MPWWGIVDSLVAIRSQLLLCLPDINNTTLGSYSESLVTRNVTGDSKQFRILIVYREIYLSFIRLCRRDLNRESLFFSWLIFYNCKRKKWWKLSRKLLLTFALVNFFSGNSMHKSWTWIYTFDCSEDTIKIRVNLNER